MEPRILERFMPEPEPPRKIMPSLVFHSRMDSMLSSTERMKHADIWFFGLSVGCQPQLNHTGELNAAIWLSRMCVSSSSKAAASSSEAKYPPSRPQPAIVPATRPIICLTDDSRSGVPSRPRKYFWATMLVAFCDHVTGNSTPRCSNAGSAGSPMTASRISHSTQSKGCLSTSVKRRGTLTPAPLAVTLGAAALRLWDMTSPSIGSNFAGTTDDALGLGWNGAVDRELVLARKGVVLEAPDYGLELVEVGEVPVDRRELDRAHGVHAREATLGQVADALGGDLGALPVHLGGDPRRHRLDLLLADGAPAGRAREPALQLLAVEALARAVPLYDGGALLLDPLVGGEALPAGVALAAAPDRVGGGTGVDHRGRLGRAERAKHMQNSTRSSTRVLLRVLDLVPKLLGIRTSRRSRPSSARRAA